MEASPSSARPESEPLRPPAAGILRGCLDRDVLDRWCERGVLGLILAILVFGPLAFGAVGSLAAVVMQTLTVAVLGLWVGRVWLNRSYRMLWPPICWAVTAFMLYAIVRYRMVLAENGIEYVARQELIWVLVYGALFFAILNNLSRQESTQIISVTLLALGTLLSMYAIYQFLTKSGRVLWAVQYPAYLGRGSGTYICPNHLAGYLEMILPLGLALTLAGRFTPTAKVFLGYASLAVFAGIAVTVSRGAWVATTLGLIVFFALLMRQRGQRLVGVMFLALLVGGAVFFMKNLALFQRRQGMSAEVKVEFARLQLWKPAYQMWQDHFWWGTGPAHFDARFRQYRPDDIQMRPLYAHNDYLNTLADWGLAGALVIAAAVLLLFWGVFQSWKFVRRANDLTTKRSNRSAFVLGAAAGLLALLAHSAVDFNMHIPANAAVAIALMAMITGHLRFATERYWWRIGAIGKPLLTGACLLAAAYLGQQAYQRGREHMLLEQAAETRALSARIDALKRAHAAEPRNAETTYEIGETLRLASWEGTGPYREQATEAIEWFQRGIQLNRFDPYNYMGLGMCLHWLNRSEEAKPFFEKALALDPRNYVIQGHMGWHYFQLGDWAQSKHWFEEAASRSHWHPDPKVKRYEDAYVYLRIIERKMAEEGQSRK